MPNKLQIVSPALEPRAIEKAAKYAECRPSTVQLIASVNHLQIRKIRARGYDCLGEISIEIKAVAKEYGARLGIEQAILDECTRLVIEKFLMIAVSEIRAAYRSWAAGEIHPEGAEMYGGVMDVRQLGKVLLAWVQYRDKIHFEYTKEVERLAEEAREVERKKIADIEFEKNFPSMVADYAAKATTWQDVPGFLYDAINSRSPIEFKNGEKGAILAEAERLAREEIEREKTEALIRLRHISAIKLDSELEGRAKTIARKISVFRKVFNK